ncbi:MAG: TadE/TadG family type IV pilus assembly protein [Pseudolabrys sp.]
MFENARGKIDAGIRRLLPTRMARRFVRHEDGAAAVEFALVAVPFLALIFAILETALVFFAGQTLEAAVSDAGRLIMTGQAQTQSFSQADFKSQVCARLAGGLFDCTNGIYINVKTFNTFGTVSTTPPVNNGQFDTTKMNYTPGGPGCIVAVSVYYQWPIYVSMLGDNLSTLGNGTRLLEATSVFRNEPYGPVGAC